MADGRWVRAATLDRIGDLMDDTAGVRLRDLPPFTTLLVWTINSLYRVVITQWPEVYIQGGASFPDPTPVDVVGVSIGGIYLRVGGIGIGLSMEIHAGDRHIITSPVLAITTEQAPSLIVH